MLNLFITIIILLILFGFLLYHEILNPISIYNLIWGIIVVLYNLQLTPLQNDLLDKTYFYILLSCVCLSFFCFISNFLKPHIRKSKETLSSIEIDKLFDFWILIEIIEVIYSKGFPLLWKIIGSTKTYFDFGIPSLHGFANAFGLVLVSTMFYKYLKNNSKYLLYRILIMMIFYVFLLTRQVIISMFIQMFVIYCFYNKKIPWIKILIAGVLGIIAFGILGNIRTGYEAFLSVSMIKSEINPMFVGIYWVYMYLTMTIANLNKVFGLIFDPVGSIHIASVYFPSFIRNTIFVNREYGLPNYLVTQAFNVSGYFMDFYLSYGVVGIIIISSIYGMLGGNMYKKMKKEKNEKNVIYYSIYLQIVILSFFYNHLFYLPSGFQFIIVYMLYKNIKIKLGNKIIY